MSVQRKLALIDVTDKTHSVFHQIVIIIYIIASRIKVLFFIEYELYACKEFRTQSLANTREIPIRSLTDKRR